MTPTMSHVHGMKRCESPQLPAPTQGLEVVPTYNHAKKSANERSPPSDCCFGPRGPPTRNNMHTFSAARGHDICSNKSLTTSIPLQHRHTVRRHSAAAGAAPCAAAVAARRNAAGARGIRCRAATVSACNKYVMISACLLQLHPLFPASAAYHTARPLGPKPGT